MCARSGRLRRRRPSARTRPPERPNGELLWGRRSRRPQPWPNPPALDWRHAQGPVDHDGMKAFRLPRLALLLATCLLGVSGVVAESPAPVSAAATVPAFDHIFTIVMENHSYNEIIGNSAAPYINSLASQYGVATRYFAVTHSSMPTSLPL